MRTNTTPPDVVNRILDLLTEPGKKRRQQEIADIVGVSQFVVSRVAQGRHPHARQDLGHAGRTTDPGQPDADAAHHQLDQPDPSQRSAVEEVDAAAPAAGAADQAPEGPHVAAGRLAAGGSKEPTTTMIPCQRQEDNMGMLGIMNDAEAYGFATKTNQHTHKTSWGITCSECHTEHMKSWPANMPPEQMTKAMRAKGWEIAHGKPPVCADCLKRMKEEKRAMKTAAVAGGGTKFTVVNEPIPLQPPQTDRKIQRKVFLLLETHFDENKRRYRDGYDDERVAREAETSLSVVIGIREDAYGKLAEPPEWVSLRNDLTTLRNDISLLETALLDQVAALLEPLKKRLQKLQERVDANGYRKENG